MRLGFNIALLISVLYCPWWVGLGVVIAGCFFVDRFYEVIVYGIMFDALYATQLSLHGFWYMATLITTLVFVFASFIRTRLAW